MKLQPVPVTAAAKSPNFCTVPYFRPACILFDIDIRTDTDSGNGTCVSARLRDTSRVQQQCPCRPVPDCPSLTSLLLLHHHHAQGPPPDPKPHTAKEGLEPPPSRDRYVHRRYHPAEAYPTPSPLPPPPPRYHILPAHLPFLPGGLGQGRLSTRASESCLGSSQIAHT